jgi:hypothetical protein
MPAAQVFGQLARMPVAARSPRSTPVKGGGDVPYLVVLGAGVADGYQREPVMGAVFLPVRISLWVT